MNTSKINTFVVWYEPFRVYVNTAYSALFRAICSLMMAALYSCYSECDVCMCVKHKCPQQLNQYLSLKCRNVYRQSLLVR